MVKVSSTRGERGLQSQIQNPKSLQSFQFQGCQAGGDIFSAVEDFVDSGDEEDAPEVGAQAAEDEPGFVLDLSFSDEE